MTRPKYTVHVAPFNRIFGNPDDLTCAAARAAVLFQDLRLESSLINAASLASEGALHPDEVSKSYRQLYGLRRGIATLREFGTLILSDVDEKRIAPRLGPDAAARWTNAKGFFTTNALRIRNLRNDFGGHLQRGAVQVALKRPSSPETQAIIEVVADGQGVEVARLKFASEVAAKVFLREASHEGEPDVAAIAYFDAVWALFSEGVRHASTCTYCLTLAVLLPKFR